MSHMLVTWKNLWFNLTIGGCYSTNDLENMSLLENSMDIQELFKNVEPTCRTIILGSTMNIMFSK